MDFNFGTSRPQVTQQIFTFGLNVPGGANQAIPISTTITKDKLITTFIVSNPVAGSSVYLGGPGVTSVAGANQGLEIVAGTAPAFRILQEDRELYEVMTLLGALTEKLQCKPADYIKIPFICWDLTQLFLFSANAAGSAVTIAAFPQPYL
jgi:hypothetical protein